MEAQGAEPGNSTEAFGPASLARAEVNGRPLVKLEDVNQHPGMSSDH